MLLHRRSDAEKGLLCTRPVPGGRQMEPAEPMPGEIITESAR